MKEAVQNLSDSELRVLLAVFQDTRDLLAREGHEAEALADFYATLVALLGEEKRDRQARWRGLEAALLGVEAEDLNDVEWTGEVDMS